MPRSTRAYGDPLPKTLANAIAYVLITQGTRGLHMSTVSKLMDLYEFADRQPHYRFGDEALKLAEASVYWPGYEWLKANGGHIKSMTRHSMRMIEFWGPDNTYATLHKDGSVFLYPMDGKWKTIIDGARVDRTRTMTRGEMQSELAGMAVGEINEQE